MLNITRLSDKIAQKGLTISALADSIGVNKSTFYRKLNNGGDNFLLWEIESVAKHLGLSQQDIIEIFLS